MIKKYKWAVLISSAVILIPILFGAIIWNRLPELMVTHWSYIGTADALSTRAWTVFLLPSLLLAIHWLCLLITAKLGQPEGQNKKAMSIMFWIMPMLSLMTNGFIYATAFGLELNPMMLLSPVLGIAFIFIGNYMPKIKQNATMGIKIKWVYTSEENWNQTHRLAGKIWVGIGLLCLLTAFLPLKIFAIVLPIIILAACLIPTAYSYLYYKKESAEGKLNPVRNDHPEYRKIKRYAKGGFAGVIVILALVAVLLFTGDLSPIYSEESFTMKSTYTGNLTLNYDDIDNIEYREQISSAQRVMGYGSPRLAVGTFRCSEFGTHTRYTYVQCKSGIILTVDDKTIVINQADADATLALYNELMARSGR